MVRVTDVKVKKKGGGYTTGYYMDNYLKSNLDGVPDFLAKEWDVIGIITGHGKVGTGKSTEALQCGYYLAWLLAGGKTITETVRDKKKKVDHTKVKEIVKPKKPVRFGMENIVFTPEELMKTAETLYKKYGPGQVIVYDEGTAGLDSANAMMSINKAMNEFMQRCRVFHHIILIVAPNFFKFHEDHAVARSLFLIDTYPDAKFNRGYFAFYNELQKEKLYFFGKKRIGIRAKYLSSTPNFRGRFSKWMPVDKKEYDKAKIKAINAGKKTRSEVKYKKQRDGAIYLLKKYSDMASDAISSELSAVCGIRLSPRTIRYSISNITKQKESEID